MGVNASRVRSLIDTDASVTLKTAGTVTSTTTETAISLNELDLAYWQDGTEIPYGVLPVNINITALDLTTADETYVIDLMVDDVLGMSDTPRSVGQLTVRATGFYKMFIDTKSIPLLDSDTSGTDKFLAIKATLGGTTPILTYGAWLGRPVSSG